MKTTLMIAAAVAATVLPVTGVAHADPAPDPNGPKCWVMQGWQQVPPPDAG